MAFGLKTGSGEKPRAETVARLEQSRQRVTRVGVQNRRQSRSTILKPFFAGLEQAYARGRRHSRVDEFDARGFPAFARLIRP
jgi:hypothetical protein